MGENFVPPADAFIAVRFGNGDFQEIDVREHFTEGSYSEWKDLDGDKRCVGAIVVVGRSDSSAGASRVTLIGR